MAEFEGPRPQQREALLDLDAAGIALRPEKPRVLVARRVEHGRVELKLVVDARQLVALEIEKRQIVDLDKGGAAANPRIDQAGDEHRTRDPFERAMVAPADHGWRIDDEGLARRGRLVEGAAARLGDLAQARHPLAAQPVTVGDADGASIGLERRFKREMPGQRLLELHQVNQNAASALFESAQRGCCRQAIVQYLGIVDQP